MASNQRMDVPDGLQEEYYQINPDIMGSFPKYRPPLNIFVFKEEVGRVAPYFKIGGRLSNDQVEEVATLVNQGLIFVSRADHPVYVKHIAYQLDLVLVDKNLKESEIADIFLQALTMRMRDFLDQPVPVVFEKLKSDLMVLTEYLWKDVHRIRALMRRLHGEHSLEKHSVNAGIVGTALFGRLKGEELQEGGFKRQTFDRIVIGLFLHDLGMPKIPPFIREKTKPLTGDERTKIENHPKMGYEMLGKLDLKFPEVEACVIEHHERLNGKGYPQKKSAANISQLGRLCAVADSFAAMITNRPYAEAMDQLKAAATLARDPAYDPELTKLLQAMIYTMRQR